MINVAVSGAAGRMGETVCRAVEGADDMALVGRADPELGVAWRPRMHVSKTARAFRERVTYTVLAVYYVTAAHLDPVQLVLVGTVLEAATLLFEVPTGDNENFGEMIMGFAVAVVTGVLLMYFVLVVQFGSFLDAGSIFL